MGKSRLELYIGLTAMLQVFTDLSQNQEIETKVLFDETEVLTGEMQKAELRTTKK